MESQILMVVVYFTCEMTQLHVSCLQVMFEYLDYDMLIYDIVITY